MQACAPSNYNIALLPWSPLAAGVLSDKYYDAAGKMLELDKTPGDFSHVPWSLEVSA